MTEAALAFSSSELEPRTIPTLGAGMPTPHALHWRPAHSMPPAPPGTVTALRAQSGSRSGLARGVSQREPGAHAVGAHEPVLGRGRGGRPGARPRLHPAEVLAPAALRIDLPAPP